jgi:hypothetical protein
MWLHLVGLLGFLALLIWAICHYCVVLPRQESQRLEQLRLLAEKHGRAARPLKDYVANIQPRKFPKIPFRIPFLGSSPPTFANIRRFTALAFGKQQEVFYVRDEQGIVYGPAEQNAVLIWISEERITSQTFLSNHETGPWLPARQIKVFQAVFEESASASVRKRFENIQIK